jgi:trehalose/maltose hydrolase-like predicted phosphorylase
VADNLLPIFRGAVELGWRSHCFGHKPANALTAEVKVSDPISPDPVRSRGERELPAYVSNGLIGLRVMDVPLNAGMARVSGFAGEHPERRIEAAAAAPYPVAGDLAINGVWLSDVLHQVRDLEQSYDFSSGELTSRFVFSATDVSLRCEILTFASREDPTLVCQEVSLTFEGACDVNVKSMVDAGNVPGRALRQMRDTPGQDKPCCDGALLWESAGGLGKVGLAHVSEMLGGAAAEAEPKRPRLDENRLATTYGFRARAGQRYRLRQITSVVCGAMHNQPDQHAARMAAKARFDGFDTIRAENKAVWAELWKSRIVLIGAEKRWQALADAAFFYLNSSVHPSSPASTSIFGLATWHDYHYYYGHVMWDIEAFAVPVLSVLQPEAADSILDYRFRTLQAAQNNARLLGRRGVQFAWESAPSTGDEAAPLPGTAAWHEDHVSLDVARAFALHANVSGDSEFLRQKAWPVLSGVAKWITTRAAKTRRGYEVRASMGIAERKQTVKNAAFTNMASVVVLRDAIEAAGRLGHEADPEWTRIADAMVLPHRGKAIISHDDYRRNEEKGATPDPLIGIWPLGFPVDESEEQATLKFYLDQSEDYIGSPMLSSLYGAWAARSGDQRLALKMLDDGYALFISERFLQALEYRPDKFPEQPLAGPFMANMCGFLMGLLFGFTGIQPSAASVTKWSVRKAVLPVGWEAIEVDRVWVRGKPMALSAAQGEFASLVQRG